LTIECHLGRGARRQLNHAQLTAIGARMMPALTEEARKRQEATRAKTGERADERPCIRAGAQDTGEAADLGGRGEAAVEAAKIVGVGSKSVYQERLTP
jgi:hypothetical protein